jgi:hypothetical protein
MIVYPSVLAHRGSGVLLLLAFAVAVFYVLKGKGLDAYRMTVLLLVGSIALGVHGLSHRFVLSE